MGGIGWQAEEMDSQSTCFLGETDAHAGKMPVKLKDYWPCFKKVLDGGMELLLGPLDVIALFHPAGLAYTVAGSSRTTLCPCGVQVLAFVQDEGEELMTSCTATYTESNELVVLGKVPETSHKKNEY